MYNFDWTMIGLGWEADKELWKITKNQQGGTGMEYVEDGIEIDMRRNRDSSG